MENGPYKNLLTYRIFALVIRMDFLISANLLCSDIDHFADIWSVPRKLDSSSFLFFAAPCTRLRLMGGGGVGGF